MANGILMPSRNPAPILGQKVSAANHANTGLWVSGFMAYGHSIAINVTRGQAASLFRIHPLA